MGPEWDLGQATEFLVVAATLLDLKTARLLPSADVEDEEDLALLEARDLLFARLLQYRAYKEAAGWVAGRMADEADAVPAGGRARGTLRRPAARGPARPGAGRSSPRSPPARWRHAPAPMVSVDHLHAPRVSVREQAAAARGPPAPRADARPSGRSSPTARTRCTSSLGSSALLELYRERPSPSSRSTRWGSCTSGGPAPTRATSRSTDEFDDSADDQLADDAARRGDRPDGARDVRLVAERR